MADTNGVLSGETAARNSRPPRVMIGGELGGVAAANIRETFSAYELQFFCQVDWSPRWAGKIAKVQTIVRLLPDSRFTSIHGFLDHRRRFCSPRVGCRRFNHFRN